MFYIYPYKMGQYKSIAIFNLRLHYGENFSLLRKSAIENGLNVWNMKVGLTVSNRKTKTFLYNLWKLLPKYHFIKNLQSIIFKTLNVLIFDHWPANLLNTVFYCLGDMVVHCLQAMVSYGWAISINCRLFIDFKVAE